MSKYVSYDCKALKNIEILLAALASLGWDSGKVEVHDKPVVLYGYEGRARQEKANVVIRRNRTGISASNDIGFLKTSDGTYQPIVSEYDASLTRYGKRHAGPKFVDSVQAEYGKVASNQAISTVLNTTIPRLKKLGQVPRHATAKTVTAGTTTKIVLTY